MKKFAMYLFVFAIATVFLSSYAYSSRPQRTKITRVSVELDNLRIHIFGHNFGNNPQVWLAESELVILSSADNHIEAVLPEGIEEATYRLVVSRHNYRMPHPLKTDTMDVTIGCVSQEPPGERGVKVFSADGEYLGILASIHPRIKASTNSHHYTVPNNLTVYLPTFKKFFTFSLDFDLSSESGWNLHRIEELRYQNLNCEGETYAYCSSPFSYYWAEGSENYIHTFEAEGLEPEHYMIDWSDDMTDSNSYVHWFTAVCTNAPFRVAAVTATKIGLPFNYPVALPLGFVP